VELLAGGTLRGQVRVAVRGVSRYFDLSGHWTSLELQLAAYNLASRLS
jgi:hypothetical protein